MSSGKRQLTRLQQEVAELRSLVDVRFKELEVKVRDGASALTKGLGDSLAEVHTMCKASAKKKIFISQFFDTYVDISKSLSL